MEKCVIIVNDMSGNGKATCDEKLNCVFGNGFDTNLIHLRKPTKLEDFSDYDKIVVCGGDGTLNGIINCKKKPTAEIVYCPFGTLNEFATGKSHTKDFLMKDIGKANKINFAYVFASGIFTQLGYVTKNKHKRRFKSLAYWVKVISQYKLHDIKADLSIDGEKESGTYTLLMIVDSPKCFGFKFNRMYDQDDGIMHMLAINTPKQHGLIGAIKVFFPLFRAFFIGFDKPYKSKHMFFKPFLNMKINLQQKTDFCMDGEKVTMNGNVEINTIQISPAIKVISKETINEKFNNRQCV